MCKGNYIGESTCIYNLKTILWYIRTKQQETTSGTVRESKVDNKTQLGVAGQESESGSHKEQSFLVHRSHCPHSL